LEACEQSRPDNAVLAGTDTERALVFQIVHGSFVDGPGIRTTIFLKGCPLSCLWCCNPEGQAQCPELKVTATLCNGCGNCLEVCSTAAIALTDNADPVVVDRALCTGCLMCVEVCHAGALDRYGVWYTVDELFAIAKKDEQYYGVSGGGVTIGGGEPTLQSRFVRAFVRKCREHYIHTALDTCGYTVNEEGLRALQEADMVLFDIKGLDPDQHFVDTAVSNETILRNLKHLSDLGKPIIVRMPLIPGHNVSDRQVSAAAQFMAGLPSLERVDLMAYHRYGTVKYGQLGRAYGLTVPSLPDNKVDHIKQILENHGLRVQIGG